MERCSQREHVLLGFSPQRSFENSAKTSDANSEMDFSDVFGGPPKRLSIQETAARYSFSETTVESEEDTVLQRSPWSGLDEKPVFGVENAKRSPYPSDDFFDDIFKGDEAKSRRNSRDFFATSPGLRILSPSKPLPPKTEPLSPSFPAQFSLPAKLTKATDFALFGSTNRSPYKNKDGNSNGISHEHTSNLSRFASQATDVKDETRNDRSFYRPSPLSHEVSHHNSEEPSFEAKSDGKEMGAKMKNYSENKETPLSSDQFHFSIYKWPGSGVPLLMHLGGRNRSRFKERFKTERCSSSNGRIESDSTNRHLPSTKEHTISLDTESVYLKINNEKHDESSNKEKIEPRNDAGEVHLKIPELNFIRSEEHAIPQGEVIPTNKTEKESQSKGENSVGGKNEKETDLNKGQAPKVEPKPLHALLNEENQGQGNTPEGKENKVRVTNEINMNAGAKKTDGKGINSNRTDAIKTSTQGSTTYSGNTFGRSRSSAKGKVSEFVKIFNQETSAKSKTGLGNQSSRWKGMDINGTENGLNNAVKTNYKVHKLNKDKMPEASSMEDDNFNKNKAKQESHFNSSVHKTSDLSTNQKNASIVSDSCPSENDKVESRTESFHAYFQVEELTQVDDKNLQTSGDSEDIKASNAKIQQWSNGRKGNIRSLLSTLQFVLWPESGWKPVPLVDLIEGSAVKRAYQRALLCLHPDKLQQKGAASHQKYIAEQVFDILQEAWDHFNSLGAI